MRKIQKAVKIHKHYKMKILLNAKVKYYKSGITNIYYHVGKPRISFL